MNDQLIHISQELPAWLWHVLLILFSVCLGIAIKIVLIPLVRKEAIAQASYSLFRSFIKRFNRLLSVLIPLLVFNSLLPVTRFNAQTLLIIGKITEVLLIVCFALVFIKSINVLEDYLYHRNDII